jgi:NADH-quinone oxidoreductase subunit G
MDFPRRTFDGEGVRADVDFGPTLMLNRNRCILCTRCVRFMREIDGDAQINIIDRGYGSEIATFQEQGVHSILSGNLMDVCPVGALLTKDYRFKSRPWDNPLAADTICTQCAKGCSVTAWIKAKPEWAKGSRLVRFTPRFNPDVNGYWMCDIGRFEYHWIEGTDRVRHPLMRDAQGIQQPVEWRELWAKTAERLAAVRSERGDTLRFLVSAHASHEELFLLRKISESLGTPPGELLSVSWRVRPKPQPATTKFKVPDIDAPNVNGARLMGLVAASADPAALPDVSALRQAVEAGRVAALYVFDPGPEGTLGEVDWIVDARHRGQLPLLIVQGVLLTALARAADFVLPGASYVEKEASYTNDQGRLQGTSQVMVPPGEAMEDWQILVNLGLVLGLPPFEYTAAAHIRADVAARHPDVPGLQGITALAFGRPMPARHWLQASNPSERWKWDFMFQDLPPVKGEVVPEALPLPAGAIPLRHVEK